MYSNILLGKYGCIPSSNIVLNIGLICSFLTLKVYIKDIK